MLLNLSIIIFCVLFTVLCWKKNDWAIALVVFMLPSYLIRFKLLGMPMTVLEAMILILILIWVVTNYLPARSRGSASAKAGKTIQIDKSVWKCFGNYKWPILLLLISATISIFFSSDKMAALGIWKAYFAEPVLFLIVLVMNHERTNVKLIIKALGASAMVVAIYAVIQKFTGWGIPNEFWAAEATRRVTSFFGYPNAVGLYLAPIAVLFAGLIVTNYKSITNITNLQITNKAKSFLSLCFYVLVFLCSLLAIYYAKSEGALIAMLAAAILLALLYPKKKVKLVLLVLLVSFVSLALICPLIKNYVSQKITLSDLSGQIRQQQWKETWHMLKDGRLISGAGLTNYQTAVKPYHQEGIWIQTGESDWLEKIRTDAAFRSAHWQPTEIYLYPHNFILNFWSETGLLGVIAMIWLIVLFVRNYWRVEKENKPFYLILICVLATILIHGIVDVPYFKNDLSVLWWLLVGGSIILTNKNLPAGRQAN